MLRKNQLFQIRFLGIFLNRQKVKKLSKKKCNFADIKSKVFDNGWQVFGKVNIYQTFRIFTIPLKLMKVTVNDLTIILSNQKMVFSIITILT